MDYIEKDLSVPDVLGRTEAIIKEPGRVSEDNEGPKRANSDYEFDIYITCAPSLPLKSKIHQNYSNP